MIRRRVKVIGIAVIATLVCGFNFWLYRDMINMNDFVSVTKIPFTAVIITLAAVVVAVTHHNHNDDIYE